MMRLKDDNYLKMIDTTEAPSKKISFPQQDATDKLKDTQVNKLN